MMRFQIAASQLAGLFVAVFVIAASSDASAGMGDPPFNRMIMIEELEYGFNDGSNPVSWDSTSWVGGDWNRIWFKTEGEMSTTDTELDGEAQLLYSRLIAPFWEIQGGFRGDLAVADGTPTEKRGHAVLNLQGLAPYWFETESAMFVSLGGDVSFRVRATYDLFITQRIIAHASVEANAAVQSVPAFGIGSGFNDTTLGFRLGYQIERELMPYVGVSWDKKYSESARMARAANGETSDVQGVAGLRFWF